MVLAHPFQGHLILVSLTNRQAPILKGAGQKFMPVALLKLLGDVDGHLCPNGGRNPVTRH